MRMNNCKYVGKHIKYADMLRILYNCADQIVEQIL